jgi:hypothetical protein
MLVSLNRFSNLLDDFLSKFFYSSHKAQKPLFLVAFTLIVADIYTTWVGMHRFPEYFYELNPIVDLFIVHSGVSLGLGVFLLIKLVTITLLYRLIAKYYPTNFAVYGSTLFIILIGLPAVMNNAIGLCVVTVLKATRQGVIVIW